MVAMKSAIFRDITPCSPVKSQPVFQRNLSPPLQGQQVNHTRNQHDAGSKQSCACLAYSLTLQMDAMCVFKMLVGFHLTKQLYIPEDSTLQSTFLFIKNNENCFNFVKHIPCRAPEGSLPTSGTLTKMLISMKHTARYWET
jgi:hypothetical protein